MKTDKPIEYNSLPYGFITTIPTGTNLAPASNLPDYKSKKLFWAKAWKGMNTKEKSWMNNYGFLIEMK